MKTRGSSLVLFYMQWIVLLLLFSSCKRDVSITQPEPLEPDRKLVIHSVPAYCAVYINNRNSGFFTADTLFRLEKTDTLVTLKYQYYRDSVFVVHVPDEGLVELFIDFTKNPAMWGNLNCTAKPVTCSIIRDGMMMSEKTPYIMRNLLPGKYTLTYQAPNCREATNTFIVRSGQTTNGFMALEDTSVWVSYTRANSGIPENRVICAIVDDHDVKWFGTPGSGLVRYDEKKWTVYNMANSGIMSNRIQCIEKDRSGNLWMGTDCGLCKFDGTNFYRFTKSMNTIPDDYVTTLKMDKSGILWVGTLNGFVRFDGNTWKKTKWDMHDDAAWVTGFAFTQSNRIYLATMAGVLRMKDDTTYIAHSWYMDSTMTISRAMNAIAVGSDDILWAGSLNARMLLGGLFCFDGTIWKNDFSGLPDHNINCIFIDDNNEKYIGTENGLIRFSDYYADKKIYNVYNTNLKSNSIHCVVKDSNGNVWVGTYDGGIVKYKTKSDR
ncbi:MAG: hypothetical protein LWX56_06085 [Ignavibacteria bacterium]|nr:hypothetical protein [Ignavibacteria bacterium]